MHAWLQLMTKTIKIPNEWNFQEKLKFSFTDLIVEISEIRKSIDYIGSNTASGPNDISAILFNPCKHVLSKPLQMLWHSCIFFIPPLLRLSKPSQNSEIHWRIKFQRDVFSHLIQILFRHLYLVFSNFLQLFTHPTFNAVNSSPNQYFHFASIRVLHAIKRCIARPT